MGADVRLAAKRVTKERKNERKEKIKGAQDPGLRLSKVCAKWS